MNVNLERADEFEFRRGRTRKAISCRSQRDSRWVRNMNKYGDTTRSILGSRKHVCLFHQVMFLTLGACCRNKLSTPKVSPKTGNKGGPC